MKGARIPYSAAEMRWLEENRLMVITDYHYAFVAEFGRRDVTAAQLHSLRKRKGWKVGPQAGRTKGRLTAFTPLQVAWLGDNCAMSLKVCHLTFCASFNRTDITAEKLHSFRKRAKLKTGRDGTFNKGSVPWSKGKKIGNNPGSARTQFKPGVSPPNTKYAGYEHLRDDGYVEISVEETNPYTGFERRMRLKQHVLWEQTYGPIPEDMVLKCKGERSNADPSNWELVPRGLLPRLNGKGSRGRNYDAAPAELKPTIMAVAKLEHQVRKKERAA